MRRRPLIAGNWKMHTSVGEAEKLAAAVGDAAAGLADRDVMISPPFTALAAVAKVIKGTTLLLAAQNVCWEEKGAFTGEISPLMLRDAGCGMAIVGHSERRHIFGETDQIINKRVLGARRFGIIPILCVGETLDQRDAGRTFEVIESQLRQGLADVDPAGEPELVLAYEPVWAIGTGKTASEAQAQEVHAFIRGLLGRMYEKNIASKIRTLYGGSVKPENVDTLMSQDDVDGVLVGGAALNADSFRRIIQFQDSRG